MNKDLIFDFCIIPNPFASGIRNIIFIAKSGDNFLDKSLAEKKEYKDIKDIIEKFGYTETDHLQFESSNNSNSLQSSAKEIKSFLENCGLKYSRELEVGILRDFTSLKIETDREAVSNLDLYSSNFDVKDSPINDSTKNKLIESRSELFKFSYKEPEIGEKVTLYFYLFLEFGFSQSGKPVIHFNGDFNSSDDYDNRNYIKIVQSDFERVIDPSKPNSIILSSCKTQKDFLREVGILYSGFFKYQKNVEKIDAMMIQEKKFPYKLAEVRKFLAPGQSIVVETNRMGYDTLIKLSNKIKTESAIESRQLIPTGDIEREAEDLSQFLNKKIEDLSEHEDFEEAAKMKKDVDFISNQVNKIKKMNKVQITTKEYFKIFSIS